MTQIPSSLPRSTPPLTPPPSPAPPPLPSRSSPAPFTPSTPPLTAPDPPLDLRSHRAPPLPPFSLPPLEAPASHRRTRAAERQGHPRRRRSRPWPAPTPQPRGIKPGPSVRDLLIPPRPWPRPPFPDRQDVGAEAALHQPQQRYCAVSPADGKFMPVIDKKAGYSFVYPFGWQEVSVQGQDKVYKDLIEPLESVSINMTPATKEDILDLSPPDPAVREWTSRLPCTTPMTSSTTSAMRCYAAVQPRSAAAAPLLARSARTNLKCEAMKPSAKV
ncbi:uncharacterized protein [Aegilops tauschii subsp. strangulata]|uniref:PsbP C-terminal domain-containing protein n=1 Tax=Aegilops tauschii subsp. strangulata TaxID=200361 RepID=A0A453H4H6_AEGTS|nr:pollen-specific leucine-rich repeat extensin-like protein 1 isoform X1 [Aegilops tauschii subsp. strangulata]